MTDCTELRPVGAGDGCDSEGQKGMPGRLSMTDCTELRPVGAGDGCDSEGQKGMPKEGTA